MHKAPGRGAQRDASASDANAVHEALPVSCAIELPEVVHGALGSTEIENPAGFANQRGRCMPCRKGLYRHGGRQRRVVLVAFQGEIAGLYLLQPLGFVAAGFGIAWDAVGQYQLGCRERLALELFLQHRQVVFIDVGITDEIGEPARFVAGQACHQVQQRCALGQVERFGHIPRSAVFCLHRVFYRLIETSSKEWAAQEYGFYRGG